MQQQSAIVIRSADDARRALDAFKHDWKAAATEGKPLVVTVEKLKARRNGQQNRLYWSLLRQIAESAWIGDKQLNEDGWHEIMKYTLLGWHEVALPKTGEIVRLGMSTASLSVSEFTDYVTRVQKYAIEELGVEFND